MISGKWSYLFIAVKLSYYSSYISVFLFRDSVHWVLLHAHKYSSFESYSGFDLIWDMMYKWWQVSSFLIISVQVIPQHFSTNRECSETWKIKDIYSIQVSQNWYKALSRSLKSGYDVYMCKCNLNTQKKKTLITSILVHM